MMISVFVHIHSIIVFLIKIRIEDYNAYLVRAQNEYIILNIGFDNCNIVSKSATGKMFNKIQIAIIKICVLDYYYRYEKSNISLKLFVINKTENSKKKYTD